MIRWGKWHLGQRWACREFGCLTGFGTVGPWLPLGSQSTNALGGDHSTCINILATKTWTSAHLASRPTLKSPLVRHLSLQLSQYQMIAPPFLNGQHWQKTWILPDTLSPASRSWLYTFFFFVRSSIHLISNLCIAQLTPGHQQLFDSSQEWDQHTHLLHEKAGNALIWSFSFYQPRY